MPAVLTISAHLFVSCAWKSATSWGEPANEMPWLVFSQSR